MTELNQVYECKVCGNTVEVVRGRGGQLVCCGQPMELQKPNTVDASKEKHVPVVEKTDKGVLIKIGSVDHPMVEEHHIEWIELVTEDRVYRKYLKPGDKPEAEFCTIGEVYKARAFCNIHGLWEA